MVVKAFKAVHQSTETAVEEISVKVVETHHEGLLNFVIGSEMPTSQVLLQRFKEMKITWGKIQAVWWIFLYFPSETLYQIMRYWSRMWSDFDVQQQDTFRERSSSFTTNCLVLCGSITGIIHGRSTCEEIDQQRTQVVKKAVAITFFADGVVWNLLRAVEEKCVLAIVTHFVSGVTWCSHVSFPITIRYRNGTTSAWKSIKCRRENFTSVVLCSSVRCRGTQRNTSSWSPIVHTRYCAYCKWRCWVSVQYLSHKWNDRLKSKTPHGIHCHLDMLGCPDLCSSRTPVLPLSNSMRQNHTCFRDTSCWWISAGDAFFRHKNLTTILHR